MKQESLPLGGGLEVTTKNGTFTTGLMDPTYQRLIFEKYGKVVKCNISFEALSNLAASTVIATVPEGYRPTRETMVLLGGLDGTNPLYWLSIYANGNIVVRVASKAIPASLIINGETSWITN